MFNLAPLKTTNLWRHFALTLFSLVLAMCVTGCGVISTLSASSMSTSDAETRTNRETMVTMPSPSFGQKTAEVGASKFALMALFANMSYSKHLETASRIDPDCGRHSEKNPISKIDPPRGDKATWRRWTDSLGCFSASGLYYEVYVYGKPGEIEEAVIAIRGTESYGWEIPKDWWTNFEVAVLGIEPKEYTLARENIHASIKQLRTTRPKLETLKIYLTGHSLGGGLAQQSAYTEVHAEAFVFNTSPVTNWSNLVYQTNLIKNSDPKITRITENGEGLSYVRWLTSRVNSRRFNRADAEFYFNKTNNPVKAHSMNILTCNFALRVTDKTADLHFTSDMAKRVLMDESLCPKDEFNDQWKAEYHAPTKSEAEQKRLAKIEALRAELNTLESTSE